MKALVISGGSRISRHKALEAAKGCDLIICADKGAEYARHYGLEPDLVIGDMDSVGEGILGGYSDAIIETAPLEKDYTDTHLAVIRALEAGAVDITMICATGIRNDHFIANVRLLITIDEKGAKGRIIDDTATIYLCTGTAHLDNKKGLTVSLVAASDKVRGITLEGFKYPLYNHDAGMGWTTGISNKVVSDNATVSIDSGRLFLFEVYNAV
jgi:thiamine pyrophosphokinase